MKKSKSRTFDLIEKNFFFTITFQIFHMINPGKGNTEKK